MKEFADDHFKFDKNGRRLSKRVENTVGKGEIARYEQFLLFPHCFQKACFPGASKGVIVWEWVKDLYCSHVKIRACMGKAKKRVTNTVVKEGNAGNQYFTSYSIKVFWVVQT